MSDPTQLINELTAAARSLDDASTKLANATKAFEGWYDETVDPVSGEIVRGQWHPGPNLEFEIACTEAGEEIATDYEAAGKRVPAEKRLRSKAELRVKTTKPDLWADYHRLQTEIDALQKWMSAKKQAISARQSVLSAEKELAR